MQGCGGCGFGCVCGNHAHGCKDEGCCSGRGSPQTGLCRCACKCSGHNVCCRGCLSAGAGTEDGCTCAEAHRVDCLACKRRNRCSTRLARGVMSKGRSCRTYTQIQHQPWCHAAVAASAVVPTPFCKYLSQCRFHHFQHLFFFLLLDTISHSLFCFSKMMSHNDVINLFISLCFQMTLFSFFFFDFLFFIFLSFLFFCFPFLFFLYFFCCVFVVFVVF